MKRFMKSCFISAAFVGASLLTPLFADAQNTSSGGGSQGTSGTSPTRPQTGQGTQQPGQLSPGTNPARPQPGTNPATNPAQTQPGTNPATNPARQQPGANPAQPFPGAGQPANPAEPLNPRARQNVRDTPARDRGLDNGLNPDRRDDRTQPSDGTLTPDAGRNAQRVPGTPANVNVTGDSLMRGLVSMNLNNVNVRADDVVNVNDAMNGQQVQGLAQALSGNTQARQNAQVLTRMLQERGVLRANQRVLGFANGRVYTTTIPSPGR